MTIPTIYLDPSYDLFAAGRRRTDAAQDSFVRAYGRAARWLGCDITLRYDQRDDAGLTHDQVAALWQAAHDSIHETRPGRWSVGVSAAVLRTHARRVRGLPSVAPSGRRPRWMPPSQWAHQGYRLIGR